MSLRLLVLLAALAGAAPLVSAQDPSEASAEAAADADPDAEAHEFMILDGHLYLDGRRLPPENLPPGLDLTGIPPYSYSFIGPVKPVVEIDGVVYVLQGEHLRVLEETELADSQVYFLGQPATGAAPAPAASPMPEQQLARMSEAAYLQQLSARDRSLYEQIRTEQALERETLRLAGRIHRATDAAERARLEARLRVKLDESFELKQQIRADEIAQADAQIEELRRLLRERAARKNQIIERRIRELLGGG